MIKPQDYTPSMQVQQLISMVIDYRYDPSMISESAGQRRFEQGTRYGLNLAFRALVIRETEITDPDDLDELCADLIQDAMDNRS